MAEVRPRFFLDEERNNSFMKTLGESRQHSVIPSDAERQSAAAIRAVVDDDEEDGVDSSPLPRAAGSGQHLDVEARPDAAVSYKTSAAKPTTLWTRLQAGQFCTNFRFCNLGSPEMQS